MSYIYVVVVLFFHKNANDGARNGIVSNVTLKKLSEQTGYSIRSVNRALKGQPGIGQETRERILEAARKAGYTPNIAARNLRKKQNNFVGIIVPNNTLEVFARKRLMLQCEFEMAGFYPVIGLFGKDAKHLKKTLCDWAGLVETVVIMQWSEELDPERLLKGLPFRFIFIDCSVYGNKFTNISVDRSSGIRSGVETLIAGGRRRIARCGHMRSSRSGFDHAFTGAIPADCQKLFIPSGGLEFADGYAAGKILLKEQVDAVFFDTDRLALGFYKYAAENHIAIPDQIAVIGFDDDTAGQYAVPSLSTVAHPMEAISRETVKIASSSSNEVTQLILKTEFIRRDSI